MKIVHKEYEDKCDQLNIKIQTLLKEIASLSKVNKRERLAAAKENANSGSGTDSPSLQ